MKPTNSVTQGQDQTTQDKKTEVKRGIWATVFRQQTFFSWGVGNDFIQETACKKSDPTKFSANPLLIINSYAELLNCDMLMLRCDTVMLMLLIQNQGGGARATVSG